MSLLWSLGIYRGRIKLAVENLRKTIGAYGFDRIAPELVKWDPAFKNYGSSKELVSFLTSYRIFLTQM